MWEISHHQRPTPALEHKDYKWASPPPKPKIRHQELILLTQLDPPGHLLNHKFHHKTESCPKHPTL